MHLRLETIIQPDSTAIAGINRPFGPQFKGLPPWASP